MSVLIVAEHDNQTISNATLSAVTAAAAFDSPIDLLVAGVQVANIVEQASKLSGVKTIIRAEHTSLQHQLAEPMAELLHKLSVSYDIIIAAATSFGKNIMPRVAALCDVMQQSDIIEIIDANTYVRPIYAGNAFATVKSLDAKKILTIRPTAFTACDINSEAGAVVNSHDFSYDNQLSSFIEQKLTTSTRPELTTAKTVISGGRGLQSGENFTLLEQLADKLHAAIGASRAAVDAGFVPNDYQVGQTGKVVAPNLYIAIGISGAIQHLAGMKDSKTIVAINKDEDAPIFQVADYGLVGDLFDIVPELIEKL